MSLVNKTKMGSILLCCLCFPAHKILRKYILFAPILGLYLWSKKNSHDSTIKSLLVTDRQFRTDKQMHSQTLGILDMDNPSLGTSLYLRWWDICMVCNVLAIDESDNTICIVQYNNEYCSKQIQSKITSYCHPTLLNTASHWLYVFKHFTSTFKL